MTEIEFFVELLDDSAADEIIRVTTDPVPGYSRRSAPLHQKKIHIKNIFRKQTNRTKQRRTDPFFDYIANYRKKYDSTMKDASIEDFYRLLEESDYPDHEKLGIAILHDPEALKERLPTFIERFQQKKPVFMFPFENDEELKDFYRRTNSFIGNKLEKIISLTLGNLSLAVKQSGHEKQLKDLIKKVKPMTLVDFHGCLREEDVHHFLLQTAYIMSHPKEDDDIKVGMAIEACNGAVDYLTKLQLTMIHKIQELQGQVSSVNSAVVKQYESRISELNAELESLKANLEQVSTELKEQSTPDEVEQQIKALQEDQVKKQQTIIELEKSLSTKERECKTAESEHKTEVKTLLAQIKDLEKGLEPFQPSIFQAEPVTSFGIVYCDCNNENALLSTIYPEILAIPNNTWTKNKKQLHPVKKVYIQRVGISTSLIMTIQQYYREKGIQTELFNAANAKQLIEFIGYYKKVNGVE